MKKCISVKLSFDNEDFVELSRRRGLSLDDIHEFVNEKYKPTEPLIKDEKIRKAVKAWADCNRIEGVEYIVYDCDCSTLFNRSKGVEINFTTQILGIDDDMEYTIAELCGEGKDYELEESSTEDDETQEESQQCITESDSPTSKLVNKHGNLYTIDEIYGEKE